MAPTHLEATVSALAKQQGVLRSRGFEAHGVSRPRSASAGRNGRPVVGQRL